MSGDAYEREHMAGKGAMLHRQKVQAPRWAFGLVVGLPFALAVIASASFVFGDASALSILTPLLGGTAYAVGMGALLVTLAGGRIAVSEGELHLQIGPLGPRIAMEEIVSCEVGASGVRNYGLGAKKLLDGTTVYSMLGDNARAVRIEKRDGSKLVIVCPDAEGVVRAVATARARLAGALPRTRVEVPSERVEESSESARDEEPKRARR